MRVTRSRTLGLRMITKARKFMIVVDRLRVTGGREALDAHHPTTGDAFTLYIDELEGIEVVQ